MGETFFRMYLCFLKKRKRACFSFAEKQADFLFPDIPHRKFSEGGGGDVPWPSRNQTVKKVADKLAGCNEGRSALHLKSADGGMYVAEGRIPPPPVADEGGRRPSEQRSAGGGSSLHD